MTHLNLLLKNKFQSFIPKSVWSKTARWLKRQCLWLALEICLVRISAGKTNILRGTIRHIVHTAHYLYLQTHDVSGISCVPILVDWLSEPKEWQTYHRLHIVLLQLRAHANHVGYIHRMLPPTMGVNGQHSFKPKEATLYISTWVKYNI
jgi:hypothetical protein